MGTNTQRRLLVGLPSLWLAGFAAAQGSAAGAIAYADFLQRITDPIWLATPPPPGETCRQFSSYDRASDRGPGDAKAWYANDDRGQYLRVDERDGAKEHVMADCEGPGCVVRIWSANPHGRLHVDIDGERWSVDFAELCAGKIAPIGEPLAGMRARGGNCHLPMPFQKRLVVSASANDLYYHVNVLGLPKGTAVPSFSAKLLAAQADAISACAAQLARDPVPPAAQVTAAGNTAARNKAMIEKGAVVRQVRVVVPRPLAGASTGDFAEQLRQVLLVVRTGGEETVRVPVSDFFAGGPDWRPHRGYFLGVDEAWTGYCNFPMPMPDGGEVELVGPAPGEQLGWGCDLAVRTCGKAAPDALRFHASFHLQKQVDTRPFHDHLVLDARGRGRFVGCALLVKNPVRGWWGEGDEKFTVDGEAFPSTFGTGTEDYFGYAWCCPQTFSSALHGQPQCDGPGNYGFTAVHRMHVLDSVPFANSFRFDLEAWHWVEQIKVDYATVAYWYAAPGATSGLPACPAGAALRLDRLPPPPMLVVAEAIEGESLRVISCSGGTHVVQDLGGFERQFSRDQQRWWRDGKPGDTLVLALPVAAAGRYRVKAAFCTANDYGQVQVELAGKLLGAPIDLYAPEVTPSGARELGPLELTAGEHQLVLRITGANEKSVKKHMVGLDYLLLERLP